MKKMIGVIIIILFIYFVLYSILFLVVWIVLFFEGYLSVVFFDGVMKEKDVKKEVILDEY